MIGDGDASGALLLVLAAGTLLVLAIRIWGR